LPVARLNYDNIEEIKSNMTQDKEERIKKKKIVRHLGKSRHRKKMFPCDHIEDR